MFHVGQLVVCIYGEWKDIEPGETFPRKGCVYTVRDIFSYPDGYVGLHLLEIRNPHFDYDDGGFGECMFCASRFRPVDDSKLEQFRAMLTDKPVETV